MSRQQSRPVMIRRVTEEALEAICPVSFGVRPPKGCPEPLGRWPITFVGLK